MMPWSRAIAGLVGMVAGTGLVTQSVIWMNASSTAPPKPEERRALSFATPPKPPPKKKKPKPKRKPKPRAKAPRSQPPPPTLTGSLGNTSFELPGLEIGQTPGAQNQLLGHVKAGTMAQGAVDIPAKPVRRVQCDIPTSVLAKRKPGQVKFRAIVTTQGTVQIKRLVHSSPPGLYDAYCRTAASQWRFTPAMYNGAPVEQPVTIPFKIATP